MSERATNPSWQIVRLPEVAPIELTSRVLGYPLIGQGAMLKLVDVERQLGSMDAYQPDGN